MTSARSQPKLLEEPALVCRLLTAGTGSGSRQDLLPLAAESVTFRASDAGMIDNATEIVG